MQNHFYKKLVRLHTIRKNHLVARNHILFTICTKKIENMERKIYKELGYDAARAICHSAWADVNL